MPPLSPVVLRALACLALAVVAVAVSARWDRVSDERIVYNNECRPGPDPAACLEPREVAGLPFAFVFDTPGVSVEHAAHVYEDEVRAFPYLASLAAVWLASLGVWALGARILSRRRSARRASARALWSGAALALAAQGVALAVRQPLLARSDWTAAERAVFAVADAVLWPSFVASAAVLDVVGFVLAVLALSVGVGSAVALIRATRL